MTASTCTELLSIPETAKALRCHRDHVYTLIAAGELRAVDIAAGRRPKTRVRSDDLADYIDRHTRSTA
jgi:excisionase family DNA binding protein